jgi:D-ribose pyranase
MIQTGILNPELLKLLARIRHTNTIVITDWAFPYWKDVETVDLALTQGIPTITDLLAVLQPNFKVGQIWTPDNLDSSLNKEVLARVTEVSPLISPV